MADIDDDIRGMLDIQEELEDIKEERKNRMVEYKKIETKVMEHLDKNVENKEIECDGYKIYIAKKKTRKGLNQNSLGEILGKILGNENNGHQLAGQVWNMRQEEIKDELKISKPRKSRKKN